MPSAAWRDEAKSGTSTAGRDEFLLMVDRLDRGEVQPRPAGVVFWSFSRFAREIDDAEYYKWLLRHRGYLVVSISDNIPEGHLAPVFEAFQHVQDAQFVERLRTDVRRGLHDLAAQGYAPSGFPPVGYKRSAPIDLGRKKNGERRVAYKWEVDPDTEARVRLAWQMKLAGQSHWAIHAATKLCPRVTGYSHVFNKVTYAGAIKCGEMLTWNAHPAYVTRAEFERVQAQRKPAPERMRDSANHPKRKKEGAFLLSGLLRCGTCGGAMVATKNGNESPAYRCDWRQHHKLLNGERCDQPQIVAYAVHAPLLDWLAREVLSYDRLVAARASLVEALNAQRGGIETQLAMLDAQRRQLAAAVQNLVNAIERGGWAAEIGERLTARKLELQEVDVTREQLVARLDDNQLEVPDETLAFLAVHAREILEEEDANVVRNVVRLVVRKVELYHERLVVWHSTLPVVEQLGRGLAAMLGEFKSGYSGLPPRTSSIVPSLYVCAPEIPLERSEIPLVLPRRGRGSAVYGHVQ